MKPKSAFIISCICSSLLFSASIFIEHPVSEAPSKEDRALMEAMEGAWRMQAQANGRLSDRGNGWEQIKILKNGHFMFAVFDWKKNSFTAAGGGRYTVRKGMYHEHIEFHTVDENYVGLSASFKVDIKDDVLYQRGTVFAKDMDVIIDESYRRIDEGNGQLAGIWLRKQRRTPEGQIEYFNRGPAKTLKILSSTRFQWATYNQATKEFLATGGGTYVFSNGKYTEHLEFYSPAPEKAGRHLTFSANIHGDSWQHKGRGVNGEMLQEEWMLER